MERPLDLSQREDEAERQEDKMEDFPSRDEPICQVENCNCPLKHIIQLDSQNRSSSKASKDSDHHQQEQHQQQQLPDHVQYPFYNHFISSSHYNQRTNTSPEFFNLKRRRVNMYNEETGQCSVGSGAATASAPENSLTSCNGTRYDQSTSPFYRTYTQQLVDCEPQNSMGNSKTGYNDNKAVLDTRVPSIGGATNRPNGAQHLDVGPCQRARSKSATLLPVLPKKRGIKRYSPDPKREQGATSLQHAHESNRKYLMRQTSPPMKPKTDSLLLPVATRSSPSPTAAISCPPSAIEPKMKPPKYDAKSIKADMIREIDSQKDDDEDVQTFRKKLFESFMKTKEQVKAEDENKAPPVVEKKEEEVTHVNPMTSLDYLISKTLMESEDKPFKARNNHIHEIIRGEKRGRLCLMDLVELQVEMGLA
ncbi:uncharacterized protein LOC110463145 [Mizuhopecten yessoensis]|uniref:Uncharacterized protein n=1 Tax=Mizuhopecten yessoensis TaxID=6573 RepID=A0A210PWX7_MIZYE|nr:uncharacterized protein LOC110463145 [Mizuhopecten yessoensis]XP_021373209.1 uncharacterized protein LOC110463145 [Mizuhopecten yessoensis]XP_021373210.1 uncharacterized protein LOC110463145 [Mizuhopecten yessoensis]OWF40991.1 hypothetical protein KP79_PYT16019 [Mizuhopecten yessoensis]